MNILHICHEYDSSVKGTAELCEVKLGASNSILVISIDRGFAGVSPADSNTMRGVYSDYYTSNEESYFNPDVILAYGEMDEAFAIEPKCPVVKMNGKYASTMWNLPNTEGFERPFPLNPNACKVMLDDNEEDNNPRISGDVFDIWVLKEFDSYKVACAMAWGCVPLVPECGEAFEWIAHGITGIIYKDSMTRDMFIEELKNDPMLRQDISTAARQWVYEHADITILGDLLSRIRGTKNASDPVRV